MTLNTILNKTIDDDVKTAGPTGEWFVATEALYGKTVEEFSINNRTGAVIFASRKGFWNGDLNREDIELFLCGTPEQIAAAQELFKLQPSVDAQLDRPEQYWG